MVIFMVAPKKTKNGLSDKKRVKRTSAKQTQVAQVAGLRPLAARPTERVSLDSAGRLVVPAKFRKAIGLQPGDSVTVTLEDDALSVRTARDTLSNARALMRAKNPAGKSLVDELLAERRAERARE